MSIDLSWSANSLQAPVHAHMERLNKATQSLSGGFASRVLGTDPRRLPTKGPWAQKAQNALEQRVLNTNPPAQVFPTTPAKTVLPEIQGTPTTKPGTNVVASPVKIVQPGIDPTLSTAIPEVPDKIDSVPKIAPVSGWLSPGANFQIR